jgi:hypothetical protein
MVRDCTASALHCVAHMERGDATVVANASVFAAVESD